MSDSPTDQRLDRKVYRAKEGKDLSMRDLLDYFSRHGSMRVSDLHLKVGQPPVYRLDGELKKLNTAPIDKDTLRALAESLLSENEMKLLDANRSVDSSCITDKMQFRLNCFHDNAGLALAVRALEQNVPAIEDIGFPNGVWRDIITLQQGLVLLTGITGAGKSTTIASLISRIASTRACRIITLEDPIEYALRSDQAVISQREVGRDVPSFERGLRDCLREDPDVIFVGEMRDRDSTQWTLTAAETGHLVFSTLHTRDTRGTVTRLLDMFPPEKKDEIACQVSLALRYVIAQKLVPRSDAKGRIVAMEILNNRYATANLIRLAKVELLYSHLQTKTKDVSDERMTTMERSLAHLVAQGKVAPLEAEKWADDHNTFLDEMQRVNQDADLSAQHAEAAAQAAAQKVEQDARQAAAEAEKQATADALRSAARRPPRGD
jgi:twitching motility protein PilT